MAVCVLQMLYFDRIDVPEGLDVYNTNASKECDICHHWYFLNHSFKFPPNFSNNCHDVLMMSMNLSDIATFNIKGSDYCCLISLISKNDTINSKENVDLTKKREHYKTWKKYFYISKWVKKF